MSAEFELINRLKQILGAPPVGVLVGIGDDAAVIERPAGRVAITVDMQVEGIHFEKVWLSPEDLGHRALAVNLSDLAAMGATPRYALVSVGLSDGTDAAYLESVYRGIKSLGDECGIAVIGGNVSRCPERLVLDITAWGELNGTGLRRSGAKAGERLLAVGSFGRAAAGRLCLERDPSGAASRFPELIAAYRRPDPKVKEGLVLVEGGASSAIDVSDGLAAELHHLAKASGVGFRLEGDFPSGDRVLTGGAQFLGVSPRELALGGGEDYALLVTAPEKSARAWPFAKPIGWVTEACEGIRWDGTEVPAQGWDHLERRH